MKMPLGDRKFTPLGCILEMQSLSFWLVCKCNGFPLLTCLSFSFPVSQLENRQTQKGREEEQRNEASPKLIGFTRLGKRNVNTNSLWQPHLMSNSYKYLELFPGFGRSFFLAPTILCSEKAPSSHIIRKGSMREWKQVACKFPSESQRDCEAMEVTHKIEGWAGEVGVPSERQCSLHWLNKFLEWQTD